MENVRTSPVGNPRVLGVDACKAGWVGVLLHGGRVAAYVAPLIGDLVADVGEVDAVAVDMPIGLPDNGRRRADELAWRALGPRRASIFMTPVRAALAHDDHAAASAESVRLTGGGISRQAFGLRAKLYQVDEWVRWARPRVVEAHPELSFAELAGAPLATRKLTWAGAQERRRLLADAGIHIPDDLGPAGDRAAVDDVLDAAAVAWTARRVAGGQARCLPDPPERFSDGLPAAIWI